MDKRMGEPIGPLKLVLGVLLVLAALEQRRGRLQEGEEAPTPKWMGAGDPSTPPDALGDAIASRG